MKPDRLHFDVDRGRIVAGMQMSEGWKLLEDELNKMLEAYRRDAVSTRYLADPTGYATVVGAHNALQSLLDTLTNIRTRGDVAERKIETMDEKDKEERELEHSVRRI